MHIVPSGLALVPQDNASKHRLFTKKEALTKQFGAQVVEEQLPRDLYSIPYAPGLTWDYNKGEVPLTTEDYIEELEAATGVKPLSVRAKAREGEITGTILVSFPVGKIRPGSKVTLFGYFLIIKKAEEKERIHQCSNCWRFHRTQGCSRNPRCQHCGDEEHNTSEHVQSAGENPQNLDYNLPRCANCHGPHPVKEPGCPARPHRDPASKRVISKFRTRLAPSLRPRKTSALNT